MDDVFREFLMKLAEKDQFEAPRTASGAMMQFNIARENALSRVRSFLSMAGVYRKHGGAMVSYDDLTLLLLGFSKQIFESYQAAMAQIHRSNETEVSRLIIPVLDASESYHIKLLVAEAIGSQDVDFYKPASAAVKTLCDAVKRERQQSNASTGL